jgi:hypothetical protein
MEKQEHQPKKTVVYTDPEPFEGPHTIPGGWDVSAFYPPEQNNTNAYGARPDMPPSAGLANTPHGHTQNTVR